jgi:uncharacterized membrane protein YeaQ/YmgE (transglycosylase-associated protein family)
MEAQLLSWLVSLVTGGVCGIIAGVLYKDVSVGTLGNMAAGIVGGALCGQVLKSVVGSVAASGVSDNVGWSGVGGIVIMLLVGFVKHARAKK